MKTKGSIIVLAAVIAIFSCTKDSLTGKPEPTPYSIKLTDAPGPFTAVNVDIQSVIITGNGKNVSLNVNQGIYNLLDFTNGTDTLIATGSLTLDKVQQIRLILGNNNSVVTGGNSYPLTVPSGAESGLKLQVHQNLQPGVAYEVLLDFDANKSVVEEGNGKYLLKPVIRTIETAISGSIKGSVSQPGVQVTLTATSGGSSYSTSADAQGNFVIAGLPAGTYTLTVNPIAPYNGSVINNITVSTGSVTNVGTINI